LSAYTEYFSLVLVSRPLRQPAASELVRLAQSVRMVCWRNMRNLALEHCIFCIFLYQSKSALLPSKM